MLVVTLVGAGCHKKAEIEVREGPRVVLIEDGGVADAPRIDADLTPLPAREATPVRPLWSSNLVDKATFDAYSKELNGERFAKFVVDLKTDRVYYFDVNLFPLHKDFVFSEIYGKPQTPAAVAAFERNYNPSKPEFLLCYLVHHLAQDMWTFAFWAGDRATSADVRRAYKRMASSFYLADQVKFRPDSNAQEVVAKATGDVPFVLNDQLYRQAEYQLFNAGRAVGPLRLVPPDADPAKLDLGANEIVVLSTQLADLTPVAGIIAESFSSPLAHTSLRAKGWGIPNIGLVGASTKLAALAGKQVVFEATPAAYTVRLATSAEVEAAMASRTRRPAVVMPTSDLASAELETLAHMDADDVHRFGSKATNLGVIAHAGLPGFTVPQGFGVPFHYYDVHVRAAGADKLIAALTAGAAGAQARKRELAAIREAITGTAIAPETCAAIGASLATLGADTAVFVRSSHNAEDLPAFSGAGLQDTVANVRGARAVCDAVKSVWSSAWNPSAYDARALAGIPQTSVQGAILVQVGVPATAAGVMVTQHPGDPTDTHSVTINAKAGLGMAVVDGRKTPESLLVDWDNHGVRILSRSSEPTVLVFDPSGGTREVPNPNVGKAVLTASTAIGLADAAKQLVKLLGVPRLDIEWAAVGDKLYIVQARPLVTF